MPFKTVIVGTGIAGLAAGIALADKGHQVTILEATSKLQAIGGIIVVQANGNRALDRLGVYKKFAEVCGTKPLPGGVRRYSDGSDITARKAEIFTDQWGYPFYTIHRADYQQVLWETAKEKGVTLHLGCRVVSVEDETTTVVLRSGERIEADLIIGADGVKSTVRTIAISDSPDAIRDCKLDVTRVNLPSAIVRSDPDTSPAMDYIALFFGPQTTIANVPIRRGGEWVLGIDYIHPRDENSADGYSKPQDFEHMREYFKDFVPFYQKIMDYTEEANVWRIIETMPKSWTSKKGRVVIIGDAAHAVQPFVGQGGAMAVEDAICLAECLDRAETIDDIPAVLRAFQEIREPRCKLVQDWSAAQGQRATLLDGPMQEKRDEMLKKLDTETFREPWNRVHVDMNPDSIMSSEWEPWLQGHDAFIYANKELDKRFRVRTHE
ncbi:uncharacterized protein PAC_18616 [Phialocephala subalpina]|uniref:FAD-binding domain-containing protein n=1 Tax=Phialocephala subalpina TaxID=576137 RepID=A0A1L7XUQ9_9HELO|nr:uncharacterized protein PAC_18616 [Phialocephala subalpina]